MVKHLHSLLLESLGRACLCEATVLVVMEMLESAAQETPYLHCSAALFVFEPGDWQSVVGCWWGSRACNYYSHQDLREDGSVVLPSLSALEQQQQTEALARLELSEVCQ